MMSRGKQELAESIIRSRFYPELVLHTVEEALMGEEPTASLIQLETHFDQGEVHRHITVLVLAGQLLVIAHLDDQQLDDAGQSVVANVSVETLHLRTISNITFNFSYPQPQNFQPGMSPSEIQMFINWTGTQRLDLGPADCPDPSCTADHGLTGLAVREDMAVRVSSSADGPEMLQEAITFARALRQAHLKVHRA